MYRNCNNASARGKGPSIRSSLTDKHISAGAGTRAPARAEDPTMTSSSIKSQNQQCTAREKALMRGPSPRPHRGLQPQAYVHEGEFHKFCMKVLERSSHASGSTRASVSAEDPRIPSSGILGAITPILECTELERKLLCNGEGLSPSEVQRSEHRSSRTVPQILQSTGMEMMFLWGPRTKPYRGQKTSLYLHQKQIYYEFLNNSYGSKPRAGKRLIMADTRRAEAPRHIEGPMPEHAPFIHVAAWDEGLVLQIMVNWSSFLFI